MASPRRCAGDDHRHDLREPRTDSVNTERIQSLRHVHFAGRRPAAAHSPAVAGRRISVTAHTSCPALSSALGRIRRPGRGLHCRRTASDGSRRRSAAAPFRITTAPSRDNCHETAPPSASHRKQNDDPFPAPRTGPRALAALAPTYPRQASNPRARRRRARPRRGRTALRPVAGPLVLCDPARNSGASYGRRAARENPVRPPRPRRPHSGPCRRDIEPLPTSVIRCVVGVEGCARSSVYCSASAHRETRWRREHATGGLVGMTRGLSCVDASVAGSVGDSWSAGRPLPPGRVHPGPAGDNNGEGTHA